MSFENQDKDDSCLIRSTNLQLSDNDNEADVILTPRSPHFISRTGNGSAAPIGVCYGEDNGLC